MPEEDNSIFKQAMQDVIPIKANKKVSKISKPKMALEEHVKKIRRKYNVLDRMPCEKVSYDPQITVKKVSAFSTLQYQHPSVRPQEFNKLKKGDFSLDADLDLHGETEASATQMILNFLNECLEHHCRFIRIIHGKGYNSKSDFPILKNLTHQILSQNKRVLAYCSAPEKDGGTGALNVLLRND